MNRATLVKILCCLLVTRVATDDNPDDDELTDDELGTVAEDLSEYSWQAGLRYRVLWRPRHCDVKTAEGDDVTMVMEYHGERGDGKSVESEKAVAMKLNKQQGQTINNVQAGLMGICLGEKRRLLIEDRNLWNKFAEILPGMLQEIRTFLDVEVTGINDAAWVKHRSGLRVAELEVVDDEKCARTVAPGDVLSVEYEGQLENGTVFDSSKSRGAPFGPFVHGRRQIIEGYTQALEGKCLGEKWRMIVPPELAYGDHGTGDVIPPKATLTFLVRLVQINDDWWTEDAEVKKIIAWETEFKPEPCEVMAGYSDNLYIHYRATREDGSVFGTLEDGLAAHGPMTLSGSGTQVPALDSALPGMCLGERRMVYVPPRLGWKSGHHDTIKVELVLVRVNNEEWRKLEEKIEL